MTHSPSDDPTSDALDSDGTGLPDLPDMAGAPGEQMTGDEALLSGVFVDMAEDMPEDEAGDSDVLVEVDAAFDTPDLEDFGALDASPEEPPEMGGLDEIATSEVSRDVAPALSEPEEVEAVCDQAEDDPWEVAPAPEEAAAFEGPTSPDADAMAPLPEDDGESDLRSGDVGRLISNTERELNRRFDDVELVVMELLQMLSAPPDPERPDSLPMQVQDGFARLETALSSTGADPAADVAAPAGNALPEALVTRLDSFEELLRQAMARSARRRQRRKERAASRQEQMQSWLQEALASLQAGIDALAAKEDATDAQAADSVGPDTMALLGDLASGQAALQAALEGLAGPDLAPLQAQMQSVQDSLSDLVARPVAEPMPAPDPAPAIDPDQLARALCSELAGPLADPLRIELEQGLDRVVSLLGAQDHQQQAERKGLLALRQGLEGVATRLDGALVRFETRLETLPPTQETPAEDPRQEAERKALSTLRHGMETMLDRMDGLLTRIETAPETDQGTGKISEQFAALQAGSAALSEQVQQIVTRLESGLDNSPDLAALLDPLRASLDHGVDRILAAVTTQGRRLEAERRVLSQLLGGADQVLSRLEAATHRLEQAPADPPDAAPVEGGALEARLAGIEARLAAMQAQMTDSQPSAPAADGTAEALRDLSMLLAEMMARQERLLRGAGIGSATGAGTGAGDAPDADGAARSA